MSVGYIHKMLTKLPQVSSKGSLTGGYFNKSRSRLEIQKTRSEKMDEITSQEEEMRELRQKLNDVEAEINKVSD
jgi:structural maintenance of chromosome 3 (chondroitin sulfate proteoglycan 6)